MIEVVIFDLDDTLMDTDGQLVQKAAREACEAMIAAGLNADLETAFALRADLFRRDPKGPLYQSLAEALGLRRNADLSAVVAAGERAFFERDVEGDIVLFDGIAEALARWRKRFQLFLVTSGSPATQRQKVAHLGIASFFKQSVFVDSGAGESKADAFRAILSGHTAPAGHFLCVGDRPDREIAAAKGLGMRTCRIRHGEFSHLEPAGEHETADYEFKHPIHLSGLLDDNCYLNGAIRVDEVC